MSNNTAFDREPNSSKSLPPRNMTKEEETQYLKCRLLDLYAEHYQQIPIYPLRPTWKHPLKKLYVRQNMRAVDHRGKQDIGFVVPLDETGDKAPDEMNADMTINSFHDIFYDDNKRCKRIFLTGESGVGKSTLCQYLISVWCSAHSDTERMQLTEDEKVMKHFSLLFYVQLSNAVANTVQALDPEIEAVIQDQLELSEFSIRELLKDETTLVLMDSLDEYQLKSFPKIRLNYKCTVVTTTRPWKLESLRSELEGKIEKQIELLGLYKDLANDLADNVIQLLNSEYDKKKSVDDFMKRMQEGGLGKFLHTPVILVQMLCLWYDDEEIGNSLCQIYMNLIHHLIIASMKGKNLPEYVESTGTEFPLNCKNERCACKRYGSLLWKISKLAYESLFREMPLVIDHNEKSIDELSETEVEICLKFGILTQYKRFGKVTRLQKSIDFVHRIHQDFFAAIHLTKGSPPAATLSGIYDYIPSSILRLLANVLAFMNVHPISEQNSDGREACQRLLATLIPNLDHALEIEKILIFTSGLNSQIASLLSDFIMEKASSDRRIKEYRNSCITWRKVPHVDLVKQIQDIILHGLKEAKSNGDDKVALSLHDIRIDRRNIDRILPFLNGFDTKQAKSISINTSEDDTEKIWRALKQPESLEKLQLYNNSAKRIHEIVTASRQSLQALGLDDVDLTSLDEKVGEVLSNAQLTVLSIGKRVLLTHGQLDSICDMLSKTNQLREIQLSGLSCATHGADKDKCLYQLNLSTNKNLTRLQLSDLSAEKVLIHPNNLTDCDLKELGEKAAVSVLKNLNHAGNLERFECWELRGMSAITKLVEILPRLTKLQKLILWGINFTQSKNLQLSPEMSNLRHVKLWSNITISTSSLRALVDSLPSHSVRVQIGDYGVCPVIIKGGDVTEDIIQHIKDDPAIDVKDDLCRMDEDGGDWIMKSFEFSTCKPVTIT